MFHLAMVYLPTHLPQKKSTIQVGKYNQFHMDPSCVLTRCATAHFAGIYSGWALQTFRIGGKPPILTAEGGLAVVKQLMTGQPTPPRATYPPQK